MIAIDKVVHSESFEYYNPETGLKGWRKTEMSASLVPDVDDPIEAAIQIREKILEGFRKMNPNFKAISGQTMTDYNTGVTSSTPAVIDYQKNTVKEMIQDCTTVDDLQRIGADASKYDLHNEWEQKYIELTKAG